MVVIVSVKINFSCFSSSHLANVVVDPLSTTKPPSC